ncbi:SDR family NAD(P)-dependent oxidoreductase, partial [Actinomadura adrarensis]
SFAISADLSEPDAPRRLAEAVVAQTGSINVLVNNAAHCETPDGIDTLTHGSLERHYQVNAIAPALLTSEVVRLRHDGDPLCVVNITTDAATEGAIISANYLAARLNEHYPILYTGRDGLVAHECIADLRKITKETGITAEDVAKRLIDYGFHAPTLAFPVAGTLMIEPTESEDLAELDRFCDAMIEIRREIRRVADGSLDRDDNPLKNAPHTATCLVTEDWKHPYTREEAAYPLPSLRDGKYWPPVRRID